MYRLRRWLPWLLLAAVVIASRLKQPWARAAVVKLRVAAECGFVPGGQAAVALAQSQALPPAVAMPAHRPSQRECMQLVAGAVRR